MKSGKMLEIQTIFDMGDQDFDLYRLFLGSQYCPIDRKTAKSQTMVENMNLLVVEHVRIQPMTLDLLIGQLDR